MRSPDLVTLCRAPIRSLLLKELWGVISGRALWVMLLFLCPIVGYSFFQAISLYGEASAAAKDSPVLASGLSPLDGMLVPTFGAFYITVTLLFPFVAIRALGREKESGALRLLVQLPYRMPTLISAKLTAVALAWLVSAMPALSTLGLWAFLGGHLYGPETLNLLLGHLLYGLLVAAIALFAASIADGSATAAIITLAFTIGSWVLDFALAGQPGLLEWISQLSLTQTLRPFEQGLFPVGLVIGTLSAIAGFAALAAAWLHPGVPVRTKLIRASLCVGVSGLMLIVATQVRTSIDLTEDRRNSFPAADQRALQELRGPLIITVHLVPEDPRYVDLRRNVLSKLDRALAQVDIRLATSRQSVAGGMNDESYGEIEYFYGGRSDKSRSTSHREVLPLLYGLARMTAVQPIAGDNYPGYPLVRNAQTTLPWFVGALPILIILAWWWSCRAPRIRLGLIETGGQP